MFCQFIIHQSAIGQNNIIRYSPFVKNNNQYLVINANQIPDASSFKFIISKKDTVYGLPDQNGNIDTSYIFMKVWSSTLSSEAPYLRIPEIYTTSVTKKYKFEILPLDDKGNSIKTIPVFKKKSASLQSPPLPSFLKCSVDCNGPDYAYSIRRISSSPNVGEGKYKLVMNDAVKLTNEDIELKYYKYLGVSQFANWTVAQEALGNINWQNKVLNYGEDFLLLPQEDANGNHLPYYNSQNNLITDYPVYAITKDMGPWEPNSFTNGMTKNLSLPVYPQPDQMNWMFLNYGLDCDKYTLLAEITQMNNDNDFQMYLSSHNLNDLACKTVATNGQYAEVNGPDSSFVNLEDSLQVAGEYHFIDCFHEELNNVVILPDIENPYFYQSEWYDCYSSLGNGDSTNVIDLLYAVELKRISNNNDDSLNDLVVYPKNILDSTGGFNSYYYTLDTGLYKITLVFKDLNIVQFLAYNNRKVAYQSRKSDVFNAIIYPNPTGQSYDLKMSSDYNLGNIHYEVFTPQGDRIYDCNIKGDFETGVEKKKAIEIGVNYEVSNYAYIVHLFTFSDGSTYSVTTLTK